MCAYFSSAVPQKWNMLVERNIIINTTYCFPKSLYMFTFISTMYGIPIFLIL